MIISDKHFVGCMKHSVTSNNPKQKLEISQMELIKSCKLKLLFSPPAGAQDQESL